MASTRTIADVASWAATHTKLSPLIGVGGFQSEPALTIANNVLQQMIQAPFNWGFNQADGTFTTNYCPDPTVTTCLNQQDYLTVYTNIQWIESAIWIDNSPASTQQPPASDIVQVVKNLQKTSVLGPPDKVSKLRENTGGITLRLFPVPPKSYRWIIEFTYQKKVPIKQGLQETWAPFPDELAYVYNQGFLAEAYKQADDPRYPQEYLKFIQLMHTALGIEDMEGEALGFYPKDSLLIG